MEEISGYFDDDGNKMSLNFYPNPGVDQAVWRMKQKMNLKNFYAS